MISTTRELCQSARLRPRLMQKVGAALPQSCVLRIQDGAQGERPGNMSVLGVYTSLLSNLSEFIFPLMCVGFFQILSEMGVESLNNLSSFDWGKIVAFGEGGFLFLTSRPPPLRWLWSCALWLCGLLVAFQKPTSPWGNTRACFWWPQLCRFLLQPCGS